MEALRQAYHGPPFTDTLLIMIAPSLVFHHHSRTFLITLLATNRQSGQDKSQGNTDGLEAEFPTSSQVLDSSIQDSHSESTAGVNLPF